MPFYEKQGFSEFGERFDEVGMPHAHMQWRAPPPTLQLTIGNRRYSSWSCRAWLLLTAASSSSSLSSGVAFSVQQLPLFDADNVEWRQRVLQLSPSGKLPVLSIERRLNESDGSACATQHVHECAAIVDVVQQTFGEQALGWPRHPAARAHAIAIVGELNTSFIALRDRLPFNTAAFVAVYRHSSSPPPLVPPLDIVVQHDIDRIVALLRDTRQRFGADGTWLFGQHGPTIADVWFAVTAIRLMAYVVLPNGKQQFGVAVFASPINNITDIDVLFRQLLTIDGVEQWLDDAQLESQRIDNFELIDKQTPPKPLHLMSI
jgi:glutathione S-transferase